MKEFVQRLLESYKDRTVAIAFFSMLVNAITGIGNLFLGFRLTSVWFIIAASYYLIMCAARAQTVRLYQKSRLLTDKSDRYETEFTVYSDCGILVCLSGLSYFFICLRLFFLGEYKEYTRIVVICIAAMSVYKVAFSIYGKYISRKMKSPIISTLKTISLVDACVSVNATLNSLLTYNTSSVIAIRVSACVGMIMSVVFLINGIFMMLRRLPRDEMDYFSHIRPG